MNQFYVLHRNNLFNLASDLPMEDIQLEHCMIDIKIAETAAFIAFEENGILKILRNTQGECAIIPSASLMTAIQFITKPNALNVFKAIDNIETDPLKIDWTANGPKGYFDADQLIKIPDWRFSDPDKAPIASSEIAFHYGEQMNANGMIVGVQKPQNIVMGCDPASKEIIDDPTIGIYAKDDNDPNGPFHQIRKYDPNEIHEEAMRLSKYYNVKIYNDFSGEITEQAKRAYEYVHRNPKEELGAFPESLTEAIIYFAPRFDNVFKIMFQHSEIYFTSTLRISYPELYAEIKKECGLWCEDTPLFKDLLTYGCKHEDCMINIILKAIYRFRNFGRDRSGDITAVIEEAKPE